MTETHTPQSLALQRGARILITGASGFIGSHVLDQLLAFGFIVRASVRSRQKGEAIQQFVSDKYGANKVELTIVPDMAAPGAYEESLKGVDGVVHLAADTTFRASWDVVSSTVASVENLLQAAAREKSVKRFVLCSSSVTCGQPKPIPLSRFLEEGSEQYFTSSTWDEETPIVAEKNLQSSEQGILSDAERQILPYLLYSSGKILSEKAAWKFVEEKRPSFVLTSIQPFATWGRVLLKNGRASVPGDWLESLAKGDSGIWQSIPPPIIVNVEDIARAFLAALIDGTAGNERILASNQVVGWGDVIASIKRVRPDLTPPEGPQGDQNTVDATKIDNRRFREVLNGTLRGLDESVKDTLDSLIPKP